jgi:methylated-DNA-[protein]-cysteine S-methyltransferase
MGSARYYSQPSPLGELLVAASSDGVCLIHWGDPSPAMMSLQKGFDRLRRVSSIPSVHSQLDEFLAGDRRTFTLPLDLSLTSTFGKVVLQALTEVPFGSLTTYGALAKRVHSYPRAVGGAVGRNPIPIVIPCHRVVAAGGSIGGFSGGLDRKYFLLGLEGHSVQAAGTEQVALAL